MVSKTNNINRGRPRTKVNTLKKKLEPKFKIKLDDRTTVYVRSMNIVKEIWRPLYPNLEVIE